MFDGYLTHSDPELSLQFAVPQGSCEDYERSLRYYLRHGVVLRYAGYVVECRVATGTSNSIISSEGGGNHNRVAGSGAVARKLQQAFPGYCIVEKSYGKKVRLSIMAASCGVSKRFCLIGGRLCHR